MHGLEAEFGDRIAFQSVNIHNPDNEPLIEEFGFTTAPELYLVDQDGTILGAWDESVTEEDLRRAFEDALKKHE